MNERIKIGMMNHPAKNLMREIEFASNHNFDFIDLTYEPPFGAFNRSDILHLKRVLKDEGLDVVGHTAYYLPADNPFDGVRKSVQTEFCRQAEMFAELGAVKMTVHMLFSYPHRFFENSEKLRLWEETFRVLIDHGKKYDIKIMIENTANWLGYTKFMKDLFRRCPELGFHLDVGHANLVGQSNHISKLISEFKSKLIHIHFSDNFGGSNDLHLPLGVGLIKWNRIVEQLKRIHYRNTITLEIFSPDRDYLLVSKTKVEQWFGLNR